MLGGASILCVLLFLLLLWMMQRMIVHPTNVILKANRELSGGNEDYRIAEKQTVRNLRTCSTALTKWLTA